MGSEKSGKWYNEKTEYNILLENNPLDRGKDQDIIEELTLNRREYAKIINKRLDNIKDWQQEQPGKRNDIKRNQRALKNTDTSCPICGRKSKMSLVWRSILLKCTESTGKKHEIVRNAAQHSPPQMHSQTTQNTAGNTRGTCPFRNLPEPRGNLVSHKRVRKQKPARDITTVAPKKRGVPTSEEHVTFVAAAYRNPISYHIGECVNQDDDDSLPPVMTCL